MFGLGMPEILLILAIALMVIGPKKLPDVAKTLGRAMGEFKKAAQDFKKSMDVESTIREFKEPVTSVADDLRAAADGINPLSTDADGNPLDKNKSKKQDTDVAGTKDIPKKAEKDAVSTSLDPFPGAAAPQRDLPVHDDTPPMKDKDKDEKVI